MDHRQITFYVCNLIENYQSGKNYLFGWRAEYFFEGFFNNYARIRPEITLRLRMGLQICHNYAILPKKSLKIR